MKTQMTGINRFGKMMFACLLALSSFTSVNAQDFVTKPAPAEIKYIGVKDDQIVFQVDYANESAELFSVEVKDKNGYLLFSGRFKGASFRKQFAIDKAELGDNSIVFTITSAGNSQKQTFDVNRFTRVIDEVSVVKN